MGSWSVSGSASGNALPPNACLDSMIEMNSMTCDNLEVACATGSPDLELKPIDVVMGVEMLASMIVGCGHPATGPSRAG